jgi:hypothetical protein
MADEPVAAEVREAVVAAYYPAAVAAADAARDRAQRAYGISSAIAGSLVAFGAFSDFESRPLAVQILGIAATSAWLLAALLFMFTIGAARTTTATTYDTPDAFVRGALDRARTERDSVNRSQSYARMATVAAVVLTLLTLVVLVADPPSPASEVPGTASLTAAGLAEVRLSCSTASSSVAVALVPSALGSHYVAMRLRNRGCPSRRLYLPANTIRSFTRDN